MAYTLHTEGNNAVLIPDNPKPGTLFFSHGFSPLMAAKWTSYGPLLKATANAGYTTVFLQYDGNNKPQEQNWASAKTLAAKYGLDTARIAIGGHSMGGGQIPGFAKLALAAGWGRNQLLMLPLAACNNSIFTDTGYAPGDFNSYQHITFLAQCYEKDTLVGPGDEGDRMGDTYRQYIMLESVPAYHKAVYFVLGGGHTDSTGMGRNQVDIIQEDLYVKALDYVMSGDLEAGRYAFSFEGEHHPQATPKDYWTPVQIPGDVPGPDPDPDPPPNPDPDPEPEPDPDPSDKGWLRKLIEWWISRRRR